MGRRFGLTSFDQGQRLTLVFGIKGGSGLREWACVCVGSGMVYDCVCVCDWTCNNIWIRLVVNRNNTRTKFVTF